MLPELRVASLARRFRFRWRLFPLRWLRGLSGSCFLGGFFRGQFRDLREQRIYRRAHFVVARPLPVQEFFQDVHGFQADIDDIRARFQHAIAQVADQIFDAMRDGRKTMQAHLRGRALYRVHRAEQAIDVFRVGIGFEREQTFRHGLQVLFGFGNEKFQDFVRNFAILRQMVNE